MTVGSVRTPRAILKRPEKLDVIPGTDASFRESSLVFHRHRIDLENLTNLGSLPPSGAWILVGGPRNLRGSGSPATIFGLVP